MIPQKIKCPFSLDEKNEEICQYFCLEFAKILQNFAIFFDIYGEFLLYYFIILNINFLGEIITLKKSVFSCNFSFILSPFFSKIFTIKK